MIPGRKNKGDSYFTSFIILFLFNGLNICNLLNVYIPLQLLERGLEKRLDAIEDTNKSILKVIYNLVRQEACSSPKNTRDHVPISRSQITLPLEKRVDLVSAKCYGRHQEPKMSSGSLGRASLAYLKNIETIVIPKDEDAHDLKKCSTFVMGKFNCDHKKKSLNHQHLSTYENQTTITQLLMNLVKTNLS